MTSIFQSNSITNDLHLDSGIRDWVVMPMFIMLILVGMGRQYVQQLIRSEPIIKEKELNGEFRQKQVVFYSSRLRLNGHYITELAYYKRKLKLLNKKTGLLKEKLPTTPANPMMSNPNMLGDMMKNNMVNMLPNFAMMSFVG